jgi:hypothetical protein
MLLSARLKTGAGGRLTALAASHAHDRSESLNRFKTLPGLK